MDIPPPGGVKDGLAAARFGKRAFWHSIRVRLTLLYIVTILILLIIAGILLYFKAQEIVISETDQALATRADRIIDVYKAHELSVDPATVKIPATHVLGAVATDNPEQTIAINETDEARATRAERVLSATNSPSASLDQMQVADPSFHIGDIYPSYFYYAVVRMSPGSIDVVSSNAADGSSIDAVLLSSARTQAMKSCAFQGPSGFSWRVLKYPLQKAGDVILVATPWDSNDYKLSQLVTTLMMIFAFVLFASGTGAYVLISRTLRPIDEIVTEAESMSVDRMTEQMIPENFATDTEIAHLIHALNGMVSRINTVFNGQRQFIADASHEMRTPLTVLRGEMELALGRDRSIEEYQSVLASGLDETKRLASLVESLGLLARGDASGWRLSHSQVFDCNRLLLSLTSGLQPAAGTSGISLSYTPCEDIAEISGDRDALRRAFANLIENGLRYTPRGGRVEVTTNITGKVLQVDISDTGVGIPDEDLVRIFDRFYRSVRTRAMSDGSGLGLAITMNTIKSHGGTITVSSIPDKGSVFTVHLPLIVHI